MPPPANVWHDSFVNTRHVSLMRSLETCLHTNDFCHTYNSSAYVSRWRDTWRHVSYTNGSRHTFEGAGHSYVRHASFTYMWQDMRRVSLTQHLGDMSHIRVSHVTRMKAAVRFTVTYEYVMSYWRGTWECACDGRQMYQSSAPETWLIIRDKWLIHMRDMTCAYVRHDSFTCETWLVHMWDMTGAYVRHEAFTCADDYSHQHSRHDSLSETNVSFVCGTCRVYMC